MSAGAAVSRTREAPLNDPDAGSLAVRHATRGGTRLLPSSWLTLRLLERGREPMGESADPRRRPSTRRSAPGSSGRSALDFTQGHSQERP